MLFLKEKVAAVNEANAYAKQMYKDLVVALKPFIGCQVIKANGEFTKTLEKALPEFPKFGNNYIQVSKKISRHSVSWTVWVRKEIGERSVRHETTVYICNLGGTLLESLYSSEEVDKLRTDYTFEEVDEKFKELKSAEKKAEQIKSSLYQFE